MAKVRKRTLPSSLVRWQAGYVDGGGKRSNADAWLDETSNRCHLAKRAVAGLK